MKHNISVIIPAFKEEKRIDRCIKESLFFFRNNDRVKSFEIIFVADRSGDKTIEIIKKYSKKNKEIRLIVNKQREEKGGSVRVGMLDAKYGIRMFYDVDLSTPLYEINESLDLLQTYDIVIGSRGLKESKIEKKIFKKFLSNGFSLLKWLLLGLTFKDTQCGFKLFKKKTMVIFEKQLIKSSAFDAEILFIAKQHKFKIKEKAVTWIDADMSNFNWVHVVLFFLKDMIRIKRNQLSGYYK